MQVLFKSRHPQATDLRDLTERRVRFVLRRLGWLVPRAEVQMSDVNGPRGGIDKRCQVELRTDGAGSVVVASVASDWRTALDTALARAARFLMRLWRRGSDSRRMRQRFISHERWLGRGELDKLIERSAAMTPAPAVNAAVQSQPQFADSGYEHGRGQQGNRKKSWLSNSFD